MAQDVLPLNYVFRYNAVNASNLNAYIRASVLVNGQFLYVMHL